LYGKNEREEEGKTGSKSCNRKPSPKKRKPVGGTRVRLKKKECRMGGDLKPTKRCEEKTHTLCWGNGKPSKKASQVWGKPQRGKPTPDERGNEKVSVADQTSNKPPEKIPNPEEFEDASGDGTKYLRRGGAEGDPKLGIKRKLKKS